MSKLYGKAKITVGGVFADTYQGVVFNPGGTKRNEAVGTFNTNYTEENAPAKLEFEASIKQNSSIKDFDLADTTVQIEFDSGQHYVMNHAFRTEVPDLNDTGKTKYTFMSNAATEIL